MTELVDGMGGKRCYHGILDVPQESLEVREKGFTVHLPIFTSPLRDQFTLAHILGHYFLHPQGRYFCEIGSEGCIEANRFAAELLMPREAFREAWEDNPAMVSARFFVSENVAEARIRQLDLEQARS